MARGPFRMKSATAVMASARAVRSRGAPARMHFHADRSVLLSLFLLPCLALAQPRTTRRGGAAHCGFAAQLR